MARLLSIFLVTHVLLLLHPPTPSSASNILFFHLIATSSHRTSIWPLVERLVEKGHKITYIFPAENRDGSHPNIEEIVPSKMLPIVKHFVGDFDINYRLNDSVTSWTIQAFSKSRDLCEAFYDSPETQKWLSRPNLQYDLVMIDASLGECAYGLVYRFKAKHVLFSPVLPGFMWDGFGLVAETASVPELFFHAKPSEMGFINRLKTTLAPLIFRLGFLDFVWKVEPLLREKLNLPDMPSILEIERNTSLILLNSHFIEDYPMALPPMIQSYSGLWCGRDKRDKGRKPLPQDIATFINEGSTSEGFVYVSFGSAVIVSALPKEIMNKLFTAFGSQPHIKFLWRWTGSEPENKPKNVMLKKWFPQRDILAHSKIKGFITQAGRPSTQEAICYGVPTISFPIFVDQDTNANRLEQLGVSIIFDIGNFTAEELGSGIRDLIKNPSYATKMKELSSMFQDRPVDPVDNALFWTEYVLRHNTSILRPLGMNKTWYQRRLLDIYAVLFVTLAIILAISTKITCFLVKRIGRRILFGKVKTE